jgi:hypothetical protein
MSRKVFRKAHFQHSKKFNIELNSISSNYLDAFRFSDEVWIIGKYKGTSLNNTPKEYIKWAAGNMKLSPTAILILENKL